MISRRHLLAGGAALVAAPALLRSQGLWRNYPFNLGIASGDPAPDGFVIWTRIAPEPLADDGGLGIGRIPVKWEVASDDRFRTIVAHGEEPARPELAHSVHVEVTGLAPDRPYWYRFEVMGERSLRGRARTLPAATASPAQLRFAVAGCQHYEDGFYTAYRHLAAEELAFVFHYGDYIYEYQDEPLRYTRDNVLVAPVRHHLRGSLFDVVDYRRQYALYKSDTDLQRAHALHSFFTTFDDHEVADNWVSDIPDDDTPREVFRLRRAAAFQAWYEHMPVRRRSFPSAGGVQMYRGARWGDLVEIDFLDTRQFRTDQPCEDGFKPACPGVSAPDAQVLGAEQEMWLARNLQSRDARWNCLAQQVMMMSLDRRRSAGDGAAKVLNLDSWAAYEAPRRRLLSRMRGLRNVVVLTGDEHQNFAGLLHDGNELVAAEFVGTSISSGGDGSDRRSGTDMMLANNPNLKFINDQRGYMVCEVTPEAWTANFMVMNQVSTPGGAISRRAAVTVPHGRVEMSVG